MKSAFTAAIGLLSVGAVAAHADKIEVTSNGTRPTVQAPAQNFTGSVAVTPLYPANEHTHSSGGLVVFEPGARSAWHTHPAGQVLIVTTGTGWIQEEGGAKREIKSGDVIWTPPGVKHWHGASAATGMSHIAVTNMLDGKNVDWLEQVSDAQYQD